MRRIVYTSGFGVGSIRWWGLSTLFKIFKRDDDILWKRVWKHISCIYGEILFILSCQDLKSILGFKVIGLRRFLDIYTGSKVSAVTYDETTTRKRYLIFSVYHPSKDASSWSLSHLPYMIPELFRRFKINRFVEFHRTIQQHEMIILFTHNVAQRPKPIFCFSVSGPLRSLETFI